jgi:hypothetical protein
MNPPVRVSLRIAACKTSERNVTRRIRLSSWRRTTAKVDFCGHSDGALGAISALRVSNPSE